MILIAKIQIMILFLSMSSCYIIILIITVVTINNINICIISGSYCFFIKELYKRGQNHFPHVVHLGKTDIGQKSELCKDTQHHGKRVRNRT